MQRKENLKKGRDKIKRVTGKKRERSKEHDFVLSHQQLLKKLVSSLEYDFPYRSVDLDSFPDIKFENTLYGTKQNKGL